MLKVIAQDFIHPQHIEQVMPLYQELVALTRQEPHCLSYELFTNQKDAGHFIFVELWPDRAALDAHCATEHFQRLVPQIDRWQRAPGTYLLMDPVFDA
ncbi:putative quinol monooxygenase [Isoalcanivorax beigongshangi]|uniref:Quinol monooxygenase n=1 Tax=Isoalcanivorax beigongshangi TaxID=3238810 RepID=A0ABV4AGL5_9GAMM